jgi:hypothetical protein
MVSKQVTLGFALIAVALLSCCFGPPGPTGTENVSANQTTNNSLITTTSTVSGSTTTYAYVTVTLPQPGYDRYDDLTIRTHAATITAGCGDDECRLLALHKYSIDNFYYKEYDPAENNMKKLFGDGWGMSSDFASFYYSYLTSLGIESYLATSGEHTYTLACGMNLTKLARHIEDEPDFIRFTSDVVFPNFDFETNTAFGRTCIRIEGPSAKKGVYGYPGQHYALTIVADKSFFIDPKTGRKEPLDASAIKVEPVRTLIVRTLKFVVSENANIDWNIHAVAKRVDNRLQYEFTATALTLSVQNNYATFKLLEATRFDRLRMKITIKSSKPFVFYTLQDANQLAGLKYALRLKDNPDEKRVDVQHTGTMPWEFEYINSCSQTTNTTFFEKECTLADAGRRLFAIHNTALFEKNDVNVTITYLEYL